jgi:hypothetical protein
MPALGHDLAEQVCETQNELAQRVKVSAGTISSWKNLPGAPKELHVGQWIEFMKSRMLGPYGKKDRETLMKEKLETEIKLNGLKIRKEEGRTVEIGAVEERDLHLSTLMKTMLYQRLGRELGPRGVGKDASQLNLLGEQVADEICEIFQQGIETWKTSLTS